MIKYEGLCCPVCHARFFEDDEIVVCPDCGAPHHKKCWDYLKHCAHESDHGTENQWKMPVFQKEEELTPDQEHKSKQPDEMLDRGSLAPLVGYDPDNDEDDDGEQATERLMERVYFIDGVNKGELVFDEKTEDVAMFVGFNASRYLRVFKEMEYNKSKVGWNWLAFLMPQFWLLGRKCYKQGALVAIYSLFTTLMISLMQGESGYLSSMLTKAYASPSLFFTDASLLTFIILLAVSLIIRVFLGLFGDTIYKNHMKTTLSGLREQKKTSPVEILHSGGLNFVVPFIVYFSIDLVAAIILSFI